MPVMTCTAPEELFIELERISHEPHSGSWYFRGQGDATWRLKPSLFREGISNEPGYEAHLITTLRRHLRQRTILPERLLEDSDYILALAQHYGAKTRLLDWTRSPMTALYFAASGAQKERKAAFAVFALAAVTMEPARGVDNIAFAFAPSGANENMAAQSGLLMKHHWTHRDHWPEDAEYPVVAATAQIDCNVTSRYIRLEIATEHAREVLSKLSRRGVDGAMLYPGMHGYVATAVDQSWSEAFLPPPSDD